MAIGYGMATNDVGLVRRAFIGLLVQVSICVLISMLYFKISPMSIAQSELLARTTPTIWDVLIAIFGGLAGIVGVTRKEKSNVIPGVAIATALMPPLCTVGYGFAMGEPKFYLGAFYLFFINSFFISLSTFTIIRLMGIPRKTYVDEFGIEREEKTKKWIIAIAIVTVMPSLVLGYQLVKDSFIETNINKYVEKEFLFDQTRVVSKYVDPETKQLEIALVGTRLSEDTIHLLENKLADYNLSGMKLKITQGEASNTLGSDDVKNLIQQELYEKNQIALSDRDKRIEILESELLKYKLAEFDVESLSKEITTLYREIEWFSIGKNKVYNVETKQIEEAVVASIETSVTFTEVEKEKLTEWIKARTNNDHVVLYMEVEPSENTGDEIEESLIEEESY